jgi:hypothetical protein
MIAPILMGVSAALSAVGSIQQANAQSSAAKFNARMGEQNAILAEQQAAEDERLQRLKGRKAIGATRAGYGASGVNLEGSPQDILEESAAAIELDALKIRHEGQIRANAYRSGAALDRAQGSAARTSGYLSATSALLGGGIRVYDRLYPEDETPRRTG